MITNKPISGYDISHLVPKDPWAKLPALAKRLGVEPMPDDASHLPPTVLLTTVDGNKKYDIFDLMNAFLDRMDKLS